MSQCGKQKRFSYSSENSAVVAFGMGGFCRSVLPPGSCPHESSQTQESWGRDTTSARQQLLCGCSHPRLLSERLHQAPRHRQGPIWQQQGEEKRGEGRRGEVRRPKGRGRSAREAEPQCPPGARLRAPCSLGGWGWSQVTVGLGDHPGSWGQGPPATASAGDGEGLGWILG